MLKNEKKYLKADSLDFDYSVLDEAGDLDEDEFQVPVSFLKTENRFDSDILRYFAMSFTEISCI